MPYTITSTLSPKGILISGGDQEAVLAAMNGLPCYLYQKAEIQYNGVFVRSSSAEHKIRAAVKAALPKIARDPAPSSAAPATGPAVAPTAPRRRIVVRADAKIEDIPGCTGLGRSWRLREGDACVYGLPPEAEGCMVRYAYFDHSS